MLLRSKVKICLFSIGFFCFQNSFAGVDIGFDYHFALINDDHGMEKDTVNDTKIKRTNTLEVKADQRFSGMINNTSYLVDLIFFAGGMGGGAGMGPYLVYGTQKLTDMFSVSLGRRYTHAGGWEAEGMNSKSHLFSNYRLAQSPIKLIATLAEAEFVHATLGNFSLQIQDDISSNMALLSKKEAMAIGLQWKGNFGQVQPLLQINIYDRYQSLNLGVGVKFEHEMGEFSVSYIMDSQKRKVSEDLTDRETYKLTNLVVDALVHVASFNPFLKVAMFNNTQPKTDSKVNTEAKRDDNSLEVDIGTEYAVSKSFNPYVAFGYDKAKFAKPVTAEVQDRTNMRFMLGVVGTI